MSFFNGVAAGTNMYPGLDLIEARHDRPGGIKEEHFNRVDNPSKPDPGLPIEQSACLAWPHRERRFCKIAIPCRSESYSSPVLVFCELKVHGWNGSCRVGGGGRGVVDIEIKVRVVPCKS